MARRLGAAIRTTRNAAGITGTALADRLGIDQSTMSDYERGAVQVSVATLLRIDEALGMVPGSLLIASGLVDADHVKTDLRLALLTADYDEDFRSSLLRLIDHEDRRAVR